MKVEYLLLYPIRIIYYSLDLLVLDCIYKRINQKLGGLEKNLGKFILYGGLILLYTVQLLNDRKKI
jgi:hypothetical protein